MTRPPCQLILVTPERFDPVAFLPALEQALDAGLVACLELRLSGLSDAQARAAIDLLRPPAQRRSVAVLLAGQAGLAAETGCDGAHLDPAAMSYQDARRVLGPGGILGIAAGISRHLALDAAEAGADFVSFGPYYPDNEAQAAGRDLLRWWQEVIEVPCVAQGGITPANAGMLVAAGADFIACARGVWDHADGPTVAVGALTSLLTTT
ncbi:MAG: thiamine phosphate synthase [Alphaproteobacteria bacterium]|nr:thiamine phosphate synthase [Alphaproteobacteria bacterium]